MTDHRGTRICGARACAAVLALLCASSGHAAGAADIAASYRPEVSSAVDTWVEREIASVVELYRLLHAKPELSTEEHETAALVASALAEAGYAVTSGVGGTGVVGVIRNGKGATVLVRGDMDALPVTENTGLAYASTRRSGELGIMHACGHDVHTANLVGVARMLSDTRSLWSGSVVIVAQPAEEIGLGARAMIEDGLFERFPRPDYALSLHVGSDLAAGVVGLTEGWAAANVDSVDITLYGRGGHGARPHQAIDPIVAAAHLVTALQTIVSRRVRPQDPAVVTVGSIHGGTKHNVIPDEVRLQLTVRSYSDGVRTQILDSIRQLAGDICRSFGCPREPDVRVKDEYTPALYNHPELTKAARRIFEDVVGAANVIVRDPTMGGEDFGRYSREIGIPGLQYRLGSIEAERVARAAAPGGEPLPSLHSSRYAPAPEPTLRTGLRTLAHLVLALLPSGAAASP